VLVVLWQVATRVGGSPSRWTEEATRYLLVWLGLLGGARAWLNRSHLAIGFAALVRPRLVELVVASFALVVLVGGGLRLVWLTTVLDQRSAALGLPLALVYLALPVAGALIAFDAGRGRTR
jgi:TRAP-type C4-dicarboxylate transport system permease small subunit